MRHRSLMAEGGNIASGSWEGIEWVISSDGMLTISGEGDGYIDDPSPWYYYRYYITSAKVKASGVQSTSGWFCDCSELKNIDFSEFDTSQVIEMDRMFYWCSSLTSLDLSKFDTSKVESMSGMFSYCLTLTSLDLSNFDTRQVRNMSEMFSDCSKLTSLDLSSFDTRQVGDMREMFSGCSRLTQLDLSKLDTSQVYDMSYMFGFCNRLTSLDISNLNTGNVRDMSYMFYGCSGLTDIDLSSFNTSQVTDVRGMFKDCSGLTSLNLSNFDLSALKEGYDMFNACNSLAEIDSPRNLSVSVTLPRAMCDESGEIYSILPLGQSTSMHLTKSGYIARGTYRGMEWSIDEEGLFTLSGEYVDDGYDDRQDDIWSYEYSHTWSHYSTTITGVKVTASGVKSTRCWFAGCTNLKDVDFSGFDTSQVTDMSGMFFNCNNLKKLNLSNFNTSQVTDMSWMFGYCYNMTSLNVKSFDTSKVTDMSGMFIACCSLTSLDLGSFNTSQVTDMSQMFESCNWLTDLNLSNFDTGKVTDMGGMFRDCTDLSTLNLSSFDTSQVSDMRHMFYTCHSLTSLDLSNFDTSNVSDMNLMFNRCDSLTYLNVSSFNTSKVEYIDNMFSGCSSLAELDLSSFDLSGLEDTYGSEADDICELFGKCTSLSQLNTPKNLSLTINLPHTLYDIDGTPYDTLPLNRSDSIELASYSYRITPIPAQTYTGKAIKPEVKVVYGGQALDPNNYTVSYSNNINAAKAADSKAPTVTVKGKGSYSGTLTATFTIKAKELTEDNTTISSMVYIADGKTKQTNPTVTLDGKKLSANKDFTVEWPDAKNSDGSANDKAYKEPGTYSVVINGTGNYQGTLTATLAILTTDQVPASKLKVTSIPAQTYAEDAGGKAVAATPTPKVTYGGKELTRNQDYTISYCNNDRAGKATLVITGLENTAEGGTYVCGTLEKTFTIKGTAISKAKLTYQETGTKTYSPAYTGSEIRPAVTLTVGEKTLAENHDYTIDYTNNVKAGKATIVLTGIGGYTGTVKKTFTIKPASDVADRLTVTFADGAAKASYSQSGAKPVVIVTLDGTELESGKDYTVSYKNNKKLATADSAKAPTVILKGKGNYKFQKSVTFAIVEKDLSDEDISATAPDKFVGGRGSLLSAPVVTDGNGKKLKANKDYTVIGYEVDGKAFDGTGTLTSGTTITVKLTGTGSYKGETSAAYRIASMDLSKAKVNKPKLEYNDGEAVEFTDEMLKEGILTVTYKGKDASGNTVEQTLKYSTDDNVTGYTTIGYKNNTKKGTATVTIRGTGEYGGTKAVKFSIVSKVLK